jgi:hypothetical protein
MHPTDGELRAYLDHEMAGVGHAVAHHVANCLACRSHLTSLAADVRATENLLTSLDHPLPRASRRPVRHWIRILATAVLVTLCVSGIAAARPGGPLHRLFTRVFAAAPHARTPTGHTAQIPGPNSDSATAIRAGALGIAFDPVEHLILRLPVPDHPGTVRITFTDRSTAAVRVQDGTVAFALVGDTVEVSQGGQANHYLVIVPRRLERFELLMGGRPLYAARWDRHSDGHLPFDTVVTLAAGARRGS